MFIDALPRSNTPFGINRDRFKLGADWRGPATLRLSVGIEQDNRHRTYQEVVDTRETTLWARGSLRPRDNLSLSMKLAHAERDASTYGVSTWFGPPQNPLLRKVNLAARQRDSVGLRADLSVGDKLSLGFTADYTNDDYDETRVGLTEVRSTGLGADASWALSEQTQLHAFVQGDRIRSRQAGSQSFAQPDWRGEQKDATDVVGVGLKHLALGDKLELVADLSSARSHSDLAVVTGASVPPFPRVKTALDRVKLQATYRLHDNLSLIGSFWHERYSSDDWHLDGVFPATVPNLLVFGEQAPNYSVNVLRVAVRFRF
jgi:MtrB/PioB family decaheme-associated outer membrane protein